MLLFVQLDLSKMNASSHKQFVTDLVAACHRNKIDGVVLRQTVFDEEAKVAIELIRSVDKTGRLIVISEGRPVSTGV